MSVCSSTLGSSVRPRKQSSVRNRPTPSTGPSAAWRAEAPSPTFAISFTGVPSVVTAGPDHDAAAARASRSASTREAASSSGWGSTVPAAPSTSTVVPSASSVTPAAPTTQGNPSWRAMIAVCDVGPPRSVTSASTRLGSRPAVSAGARSAATRTLGRDGVGTPGSGTPTSRAVTRVPMSRRSVTRSAMRPPIWVNSAANWSTDPSTAATRPEPFLTRPLTAERSPRSLASVAVAVRTSAASPVAPCARSCSPATAASTAAS